MTVVPLKSGADDAAGHAWVDTPTSARIFAAADDCREHQRVAIIRGAPGVGKTYALQHYAARSPDVEMITATPVGRSPSGLLKALLRPYRSEYAQQMRPPLDELYDEAARVLRQVALAIIDEAQRLDDHTLDLLRGLYDEVGFGLVLAGNHAFFDSRSRRVHEAAYRPLMSRCDHWEEIAGARKGDLTAVLDAWQITDARSRHYLISIHLELGLRELTRHLRRAAELAGSRPVRHGDLTAATPPRLKPPRNSPSGGRELVSRKA